MVLAANWSLYVYGREDGDGDKQFLLDRKDNTRSSRTAHGRRRSRRKWRHLREAGVQVWLFKEVPLQHKGTSTA